MPPPKPRMDINKVSRDGTIEIGFDQDMWVPEHREKEDETKERRLEPGLHLSEFDVTRDIVDLDFQLRSDVKVRDIKYTLTIVKWTKRDFHLFINFTDPLQISRGLSRDMVVLRVKDPMWFRSAETEDPVELGPAGTLVKTLPR